MVGLLIGRFATLLLSTRAAIGSLGADFEGAGIVTASAPRPETMKLTQLRRPGLVMYPKEVVAIVHALCNLQQCGPTLDAVWITETGHVYVQDQDDSTGAAPFLPTVGALLDTLLPPFSEERQYAPAASLQTLAARLQGTAAPPIVSTTELLFAIQHYETAAPASVLQQLVARVTAAPPDGADERPLSSHHLNAEPTEVLVVPFEGTDDSLDEYPSEQSPRPAVNAAPDQRPPVSVIAGPPAVATTGRSRLGPLALLAALYSITVDLHSKR
jgi:hypothetical protein